MYNADDALDDLKAMLESKQYLAVEEYRRLRDFILIVRSKEKIPELLRKRNDDPA